MDVSGEAEDAGAGGAPQVEWEEALDIAERRGGGSAERQCNVASKKKNDNSITMRPTDNLKPPFCLSH